VDRSRTAPGFSWDAGTTGADTTAAGARFPAWLRPADNGDSGTPEQQLRLVIISLAGPDEMYAAAGWDHEPLGRALVFRLWPARVLHVVGDSPLTAGFRRLIMAGAAPGWDLHPVQAGHTPLNVLAGPLHQLSGSDRFYNLLERNGFASVEEVTATPEGCLLQLRNSGPRFIAAVRQVTAELRPGDTQAEMGRLPSHGGAGLDASGPVPSAGLPADAARALQILAAWAASERGARTLEDLLTLAPGAQDLPTDVARSWDHIRQLDLRTLAEATLPARDMPQLALDLLDELEERRRLILTSRTFAPTRRTYDSLAAELGRHPRARPPARGLRATAAGPRGRPRTVPAAPLARRVGRKTCGHPHRGDSRHTPVDEPDAVLADRTTHLITAVIQATEPVISGGTIQN
jgi:hypothetical protein